jgi:hypothetical protein
MITQDHGCLVSGPAGSSPTVTAHQRPERSAPLNFEDPPWFPAAPRSVWHANGTADFLHADWDTPGPSGPILRHDRRCDLCPAPPPGGRPTLAPLSAVCEPRGGAGPHRQGAGLGPPRILRGAEPAGSRPHLAHGADLGRPPSLAGLARSASLIVSKCPRRPAAGDPQARPVVEGTSRVRAGPGGVSGRRIYRPPLIR